MRPAELAGDRSPEWLAWRHALRALEAEPGARPIDVFVCVPATSPLRAVSDLDACIERLEETGADVVITVKPAERNPYFNMVVIGEDGRARLFAEPPVGVVRRQDAPPVYDVTTVAYAARPRFVLEADSIFAGRVAAVVVPPERAIDIDTELDFQFAEFLMARRGELQER
jgi:N-acylneuraminate cytidylyltransferase